MWQIGVRATAAVVIGSTLAVAMYLDREQQPILASAAPRIPVTAIVIRPGGELRNGTWSNTGKLSLRVTLHGGASPATSVPEVEILPLDDPFTGMPNAAGSLVRVPAHGHVTARVSIPGIQNDHWYHWQIRTRGANGAASQWAAGGSFGINATPPTTPTIISANVANKGLTNNRTVSLHWKLPQARAGIAHYEWATSRNPQATPTWHSTTTRVLHLHELGNGSWQISIRAVDGAGNASIPAQWTVRIDRIVPRITDIATSSSHITLASGPLRIHFRLAQTAAAYLSIFKPGSNTPVARIRPGFLAAGMHELLWAGKDNAVHVLVTGHYQIRLRIRDAAGNITWRNLPPVSIDSRRIVVSLTRQDLTAYDGTHVLLHTLITSGGPETRTPVGTFHIMSAFAPMIMHSPWPRTSPLWYPDSPVNFALLFQTGGYFLHDAPWRTVYGPGSNTVEGIPGGKTTGTHGCVNVPYAAERWLYTWASVGTIVQILP